MQREDRMAYTLGSLFAGIGGFDLGFQRAGFKIAWQVEINAWCQRVLAKNFPGVERHGDIKDCGAANLSEVDVIAGGFPCQDISNAATTHPGGLTGLEGERSGLWREFFRVVCEIYPRWVVVENVGAVTIRGASRILADLAAAGFDADWTVIPASAMGAPHHRKRFFIVARRAIRFAHEMRVCACCEEELWCDECQEHYAECRHPGPHSWEELLEDPDSQRLEGNERSILAQPDDWRQNPNSPRSDWWSATPRICRGIDGISNRVDRLRGLGNAVVPQVAELIARRIGVLLESSRQG